MKHVWTLFLVFISVTSANHHTLSPLLPFTVIPGPKHLHPYQVPTFFPSFQFASLFLTSLCNFPVIAAEHFSSTHFHWGMGSLLRAEHHLRNTILVNNY